MFNYKYSSHTENTVIFAPVIKPTPMKAENRDFVNNHARSVSAQIEGSDQHVECRLTYTPDCELTPEEREKLAEGVKDTLLLVMVEGYYIRMRDGDREACLLDFVKHVALYGQDGVSVYSLKLVTDEGATNPAHSRELSSLALYIRSRALFLATEIAEADALEGDARKARLDKTSSSVISYCRFEALTAVEVGIALTAAFYTKTKTKTEERRIPVTDGMLADVVEALGWLEFAWSHDGHKTPPGAAKLSDAMNRLVFFTPEAVGRALGLIKVRELSLTEDGEASLHDLLYEVSDRLAKETAKKLGIADCDTVRISPTNHLRAAAKYYPV